MSLKCRKDSGGSADYTLKWKKILEEDGMKVLLKGGQVGVYGELEIGKNLGWAEIFELGSVGQKVNLNAILDEKGRKLNLSLMKDGDGALFSGSCSIDDVVNLTRNPSLGQVLSAEMEWPADRELVIGKAESTGMNVSLKKCNFDSEGKSITCDLKLTTGSDLDWSTKVSAKAKFTISQ